MARWRAYVIEAAIAAEDRVDLARLEWIELKRRMQRLFVLAVVAVGLSMVVAIMGSAAALVHFWDTPQRVSAAWIIAGVWFVAWLVAVFALVRTAQRTGNGFALTRHELHQDWRDMKERL